MSGEGMEIVFGPAGQSASFPAMQPDARPSHSASGTGRAVRGRLRHAVRARRLSTEIVDPSCAAHRHCSAFDTDAAQDLSPCPGFACNRIQMLAGVCPAGPGGVIEVTRTNAVMPTATAPITEKTVCQVSDGMRCLTMPWVA